MSERSPESPPAPRRARWRGFLLVAALFLLADQTGPPREQIASRFLLGGIHLYQRTLSPLMPAAGVRCRFQPTCSRYGEGAIAKYGALSGSARAAWRILRCAPWTPAGTVDPP